MKKQIVIHICLMVALNSQYAVAKNSSNHEYESAITHIKTLPKALAGFKWAVNPDFTDEFDGHALNAEKWYDKSPYWQNGRPPATFKAYNVSVENGNLRIKNSRLNPTEGNDGKPGASRRLRVIGISKGKDAQAYSVSRLRFHEVANTHLGSSPVSVAY